MDPEERHYKDYFSFTLILAAMMGLLAGWAAFAGTLLLALIIISLDMLAEKWG
jgi:hypothetical protein